MRLEVEGSLTRLSVHELQCAIVAALSEFTVVTLDFERLSFLDSDRAALLRSFSAKEITAINWHAAD